MEEFENDIEDGREHEISSDKCVRKFGELSNHLRALTKDAKAAKEDEKDGEGPAGLSIGVSSRA